MDWARLLKYSDDEARDAHGEWTSGGDGSAEQPYKQSPSDSRSMWSSAAANISHAKSIKDAPKDVPIECQRSVIRYTGSGYESVNNSLRHGAPAGSMTQETIAGLDQYFAECPSVTTKSIVTFRGVKSADKMGLQVGSVFQDKGFVSSSVDKKTAKNFAGNANSDDVIRLSIPPGTKLVKGHKGEKEVILPRGSKFKVVKIGQGRSATLSTARVFFCRLVKQKLVLMGVEVKREDPIEHTPRFFWVPGDIIVETPSKKWQGLLEEY